MSFVNISRGKAINLGVTPLAAAGTSTADLTVATYTWLTILARIGNATTPATAAADVSATIFYYEDDGTTVFAPGTANDFTTHVAALAGSTAYIGKRYLIAGIDKVKILVQNNNVAPLQGATAIYYLSA